MAKRTYKVAHKCFSALLAIMLATALTPITTYADEGVETGSNSQVIAESVSMDVVNSGDTTQEPASETVAVVEPSQDTVDVASAATTPATGESDEVVVDVSSKGEVQEAVGETVESAPVASGTGESTASQTLENVKDAAVTQETTVEGKSDDVANAKGGSDDAAIEAVAETGKAVAGDAAPSDNEPAPAADGVKASNAKSASVADAGAHGDGKVASTAGVAEPTDSKSTSGTEVDPVIEGKAATSSATATPSRMRAFKAASPVVAAVNVAKTVGDFIVEGDEANYGYENGVLTVRGDVKVKTNAPTSERIVISENSTVTLEGVVINAASGPAIKVVAGIVAKIILAEGSTNEVTGASGYAGVEVGLDNDKLAQLAIDGSGSLQATGGSKSAGIGGSYNNKNSQGNGAASYSGNIVIDGGNIVANGGEGGAGIGAGNNNARNADGTGTGRSASYPMGFGENGGPNGTITINGGTIEATGNGGGAGIGGGNHADSGLITINGGTITAKGNAGGAGIGNGIGSQKRESDGTKGPGAYFAEVVINGGVIVAESAWLGAGIGGGYAGDARVTINDGDVTATGGNGNSGANYQGGTGVGAGYMGLSVVEINGGTVNATGGTGSPGIGIGAGALAQHENEPYDNKKRGQDATISYDEAVTTINGGTVVATGGVNAAGIGSGNGDEACKVVITGGEVTAYGYSDPNNLKLGGAGIGSGTGLEGGATKYKSDTDVTVEITGGTVVAVGGWGASGIGSGAANRQAASIAIDASKAIVEAYADGTKFAIDTRVENGDGSTSMADNTDVAGNILQGTFVHSYEQDGISQGTEGLKSIEVTNDQTGESLTLTSMPAGYRSFATTVSDEGSYTVFTDDQNVGNGEGRYFAKCETEVYDEDMVTEHDAHYAVVTGAFSDNNYLFPVKSVVVRKVVNAADDVLEQINETFYFALWVKSQNDFVRKADGSVWVEPIKVVNGVALTTAKFIGLDDMTFDVWEMADATGTESMNVKSSPKDYGAYRLVGIATAHGDDTTNNATIDKDTWTDSVTVFNTFEGVEDIPAAPGNDPENPVEPSEDEPSEPVPGSTVVDVDEPAAPTAETVKDAPIATQGTTPATTAVAAAPAAGPVAAQAVPAAPAPAAAAPAAEIAPVAQAAPATRVIVNDANPLAAPEVVEDAGNPLAGIDDIDCWVHWWILLGILITFVYSAVVIARRQRSSNELANIDDDIMNGSSPSEGKHNPVATPRLQPTMSVKAKA